jgi:predicted amidophosphoribosyltransferase
MDVAKSLQTDLRLLVTFVRVYCENQHPAAERKAFALRGFDMTRLARKPLALCPDCTRLLGHALVKRQRCPMNPKPMCKHCPSHCYAPVYRQQIRQVMKYSGRRLVMRGRLDYLLHLLF